MAVDWKLVVDSADPAAQARFWGPALGYEIEDHSELIGRLLEAGAIGPDAVIELEGRHAWGHAAAVRHPADPVDPGTGTGLGRRLLFLKVPEHKQGKNRLHIDLHFGPERRDAEVKRLEGMGASVLRVVDEHGQTHVCMVDPEGNEFDVQ